jgi:hypothetical protein
VPVSAQLPGLTATLEPIESGRKIEPRKRWAGRSDASRHR